MQAAIGCAQLEQIDGYIAAKRRIAAAYAQQLADLPGVTVMPIAPWAESVYWLYTVLIEGGSRHLLGELQARNIQSRPLWQPLHQSPAHSQSRCGALPVAESLHRRGLSLPCSVGLSTQEVHYVAAQIAQVLHAEIA